MSEQPVIPPSENPSETPSPPSPETPVYDTVPQELEEMQTNKPAAPATPTREKKGISPWLVLVLVLLIGCLCFACGIVFGIWAWETGDQWVSAVPPVLALL